MTSSSVVCQQVADLLGAFVLGGLRGREESLVRTHLTDCERCQAEHDELAEVPALLGLLTPEQAAHAEDHPGSVVRFRRTGDPKT